jgi:prolyl oligopeptidase
LATSEKIPRRAELRDRLTKLWNYERFSAPMERGGRYFYTYNSGLQNQRVLYVTDSADAPGRVLLDPNTLSKDGTTSMTEFEPSEDGKLIVYGLSKAGSDWEEYRVRDVATGTDRDDKIEWVKFSGASWAKDGSGFYYSRYDAPKSADVLEGKNEFQKLYFHKLATPQAEDTLIYERKDHADWGFAGMVTEDGRYLVIHVSQGTDPKNRIFYKDLSQPDSKVIELLTDFDADYGFIVNDGPGLPIPHRPERAALPAHRDRYARARTRQLEGIDPQTADKLDTVSSVGGQLVC